MFSSVCLSLGNGFLVAGCRVWDVVTVGVQGDGVCLSHLSQVPAFSLFPFLDCFPPTPTPALPHPVQNTPRRKGKGKGKGKKRGRGKKKRNKELSETPSLAPALGQVVGTINCPLLAELIAHSLLPS